MNEKEFRDYLSTMTDPEEYFLALKSKKKHFRVNTNKISREEFEKGSEIEYKKIDNETYEYLGKGNLGRTFEYFLGYIHIQSATSMLPARVLSPKKGEAVLDLTASPGGKTTQMSAMMENKGLIAANDKKERYPQLASNITRLGCINILCTFSDAKTFSCKEKFDRVLLDPPCTALGSTLNAYRRFSKEYAKRMARVQKKMVISAFDCLREGGVMVYSTCTITQEENEGVVEFLVENRDDAKVRRVEYGEMGRFGARIYPQTYQSDGFFISRVEKCA